MGCPGRTFATITNGSEPAAALTAGRLPPVTGSTWARRTSIRPTAATRHPLARTRSGAIRNRPASSESRIWSATPWRWSLPPEEGLARPPSAVAAGITTSGPRACRRAGRSTQRRGPRWSGSGSALPPSPLEGGTMKAIAAILAAALCATPIAESRAESPEHPQGPSRFGRGLNLLDQFEGTFPLHAGDELVGKIAGVKVRLKLSDCTDVKPKRSDDPDQSGGGLRAAHCLVSASKPAPAHAKVPICDGSDTVPVVLVQGHWQTTKDHTSGGITAGCSVKEIADVNSWKQPWTSALAKCVELWKTHANSSLLTACIHMARAAYDGGEDDYTWPGTMVDAWDTIVDQQ